MKKNMFAPLLVAVLLVVSLTACTQAASTPYSDALLQAETIFPVATQLGATMPANNNLSATETAAAIMVLPPATSTPEAGMETEAVTEEAIGGEAATEEPAEEVIIPTATSEGLQGGCSPNVTPYEGLGAGSPTFGICGVIKDTSVTIQTNDFIAGQTYSVYMGTFASGAVGGTLIGTYSTNNGGRYSEIYPIPEALIGQGQISIRIEFSSGWFATNWFYNLSTD